MRLLRALSAILTGVLPNLLSAQPTPQWRSVDIARQLRDSTPQRIRVQYSAGRVNVYGSDDPLLYAMHLRYDEMRSIPIHAHDAAQRTTTLGLESTGSRARALSGSESGELRLGLPRAIPLDLALEFGGTESRLDLGQMTLQTLRLEYGAADASVRFSQPNRVRMRDLEVNAGAADFSAVHLANANADQIRLRGGVGSMDLDFSGDWSHDLNVSARLVLGKLTLRIPADVGVRLEIHRVATGFTHVGLIKRDDAWYSPNFELAKHKLRIAAETVFGQIEVTPSTR